MKRIAVVGVVLLCTGGAIAQQNPTAVMEEMLRQQMQERAQRQQIESTRQQNESMRLELERRRLQQQLEEEGRFRGMPNVQVGLELRRYCPDGEPPCREQPPRALIQEALRRGLIEPASNRDRPAEIGPTTRSETSVAPSPSARGKSKVVGGITCHGSRSPGNSIEIAIAGEIDLATVIEVKRIFDTHDAAPCEVVGSRFEIDSIGGNVAAAMAIGRMFRKHAAVLQVGTCFSACVLILAGAVERHGGTIGIHRPYLGTTPERAMTPERVKDTYRAMLQEMRAYLREMNVSERLADDMLGTDPEKMRILTHADLDRYGLAGVDAGEQQDRAIEKEAREVQEANQLGLDRREYMRRKVLGDRLCSETAVSNSLEFWNCKQRVLKTGQR